MSLSQVQMPAGIGIPRTNAAKRMRHGTGQLTPRQATFVRHYLIDRNGKQAAIRAGYSVRTAEVQASILFEVFKGFGRGGRTEQGTGRQA